MKSSTTLSISLHSQISHTHTHIPTQYNSINVTSSIMCLSVFTKYINMNECTHGVDAGLAAHRVFLFFICLLPEYFRLYIYIYIYIYIYVCMYVKGKVSRYRPGCGLEVG